MKHTHTYVHISFIRAESVHVNTDMTTLFHIRTVRCVFVCKYFYMKRLAGCCTRVRMFVILHTTMVAVAR